MNKEKLIYLKIIDILDKAPLSRRALINVYVESLGLTREQLLDRSTSGKANIERSRVGAILTHMRELGMIIKDADGLYHSADQKPVIIRCEECESEILKMLDGRSLSRSEIRKNLTRIFGTDKTLTEKDDNKLFTYMGEVLRVGVKNGTLQLKDSRYSITGKIAARIDDINSMLALKSSFLTRLYRKGGEFFETYFMTLLEKYLVLSGKKVLSNLTTGGSSDGGIDGIIETVDSLGFKETIMVQTKNRSDSTNETSVRGFYGAVCAKQGSRGIFATSSDFHPAAIAFLGSIDNCVGVDGSKLFEMAVSVRYGIKESDSSLVVDEKIL